MSKFKVGDQVCHVMTGNIYVIKSVPDNWHRLEHCGKTFYSYKSNDEKVTHYRREDEMEDGRFIFVSELERSK